MCEGDLTVASLSEATDRKCRWFLLLPLFYMNVKTNP